MTTTGFRLKQLRERRGWSQADVAKRIGVGRTTYLKYETGENKPVRKLHELAKLFNVSYDYLLGNDAASKASEPELAEDEAEVVDGYRTLSDDGKRLIKSMIGQLNFTRRRAFEDELPAMA